MKFANFGTRQMTFRQLIVFDFRLLDKFLRGFGIRQGTQAPSHRPVLYLIPLPRAICPVPTSKHRIMLGFFHRQVSFRIKLWEL